MNRVEAYGMDSDHETRVECCQSGVSAEMLMFASDSVFHESGHTRQIDRQTDRQTGRQAGRQTEGQADRLAADEVYTQ